MDFNEQTKWIMNQKQNQNKCLYKVNTVSQTMAEELVVYNWLYIITHSKDTWCNRIAIIATKIVPRRAKWVTQTPLWPYAAISLSRSASGPDPNKVQPQLVGSEHSLPGLPKFSPLLQSWEKSCGIQNRQIFLQRCNSRKFHIALLKLSAVLIMRC